MLSCLAGIALPLHPDDVAFDAGHGLTYFPAVPEILITWARRLGIGVFSLAQAFPVLPAPLVPGPARRARPPATAAGATPMAKRITIDPITRIEGHLRIDVEVDGGKVAKAWSSGTMWRGIEKHPRGRDPREAWLFTQRFCGVCTTVHAIASVRAVEDALELEIPLNAQYIRNLILIAHALHDHIVHFYHLSALDWVDITKALEADPAKTAALAESLSGWPGN